MSNKETIFALATAPGKSGVAIIRISGPRAFAALTALSGQRLPAPNSAQLTSFRVPGSDLIIDRGLALCFKAPASFTGEDVVELQLHGSLAVIRQMLEALSAIVGLRPAEPGEFSRRAFANGKMDLIEAEGLADLIEAETPGQKSQALRQMEGALSRYYDTLRERIVRALAHLEAYIDFPDEEIPPSVLAGLGTEIRDIKTVIAAALADHRRGEKVREGIHVVILGAPNAGKSSLLNTLARKEAAIVSHQAGTTRDVIEVHMTIAGFPVILTDTAGIRESADDIEEEGVRRALSRAEAADLKLVLFDGGAAMPDSRSQALIDQATITIISKSDILNNSVIKLLSKYNPIQLSIKTGEGIEQLLGIIEERIVSIFSSQAAPLITRHRHRALLTEAMEHLDRLDLAAPLEIACEELRLAAQAVGKITGKIAVDDVLDVIFKSFCIGK
jgi:tRNA modification GTPase